MLFSARGFSDNLYIKHTRKEKVLGAFGRNRDICIKVVNLFPGQCGCYFFELALHRMWKLMCCLVVKHISTSPGNLPRYLYRFPVHYFNFTHLTINSRKDFNSTLYFSISVFNDFSSCFRYTAGLWELRRRPRFSLSLSFNNIATC